MMSACVTGVVCSSPAGVKYQLTGCNIYRPVCSTPQAYVGSPPTNEDVLKRKELRKKLLKAKGIYLPDPDAKNVGSPGLTR